jgi:hypothetical protein
MGDFCVSKGAHLVQFGQKNQDLIKKSFKEKNVGFMKKKKPCLK